MNAILVTAIWCPSCIIMRPRYQKILNDLNIQYQELDFDDDEEEVEKLNVGKVLPVLILYKDGKEINRLNGEKSIKELNNILNS